jgi:hypothetical protein
MDAQRAGLLPMEIPVGPVPAEATRMLTVPGVAERLRVPEWRIRRILDAKFSNEIVKVGQYRAIPEALLPEIEAALSAAGHLPRRRAAASPRASA